MDETLSTVLYAFSTFVLRKGWEINPGLWLESVHLHPAGDRTLDLLNQRQTCYDLSQRGEIIIIITINIIIIYF